MDALPERGGVPLLRRLRHLEVLLQRDGRQPDPQPSLPQRGALQRHHSVERIPGDVGVQDLQPKRGAPDARADDEHGALFHQVHLHLPPGARLLPLGVGEGQNRLYRARAEDPGAGGEAAGGAGEAEGHLSVGHVARAAHAAARHHGTDPGHSRRELRRNQPQRGSHPTHGGGERGPAAGPHQRHPGLGQHEGEQQAGGDEAQGVHQAAGAAGDAVDLHSHQEGRVSAHQHPGGPARRPRGRRPPAAGAEQPAWKRRQVHRDWEHHRERGGPGRRAGGHDPGERGRHGHGHPRVCAPVHFPGVCAAGRRHHAPVRGHGAGPEPGEVAGGGARRHRRGVQHRGQGIHLHLHPPEVPAGQEAWAHAQELACVRHPIRGRRAL
mmetsp:Transcript_14753/g.28398  ORF Transcript_14753/g.28398 Transcript_14753/m.28398 type:complete len:380 (-) Transcript_14753:194-1333(-)